MCYGQKPMHGFMNFNLYRPKNFFGLVVPWEGFFIIADESLTFD